MNKEYEMVIGLEVHVELNTATKIFCGCSTAFGAKPNTLCCPVCTGQPGTLPLLNRKVVESAIRTGLALGCKIRRLTHFDRKNYFYPDLPKSYQISQLYAPIAYEGVVTTELEKGKMLSVRIHELHMEEDAGKLLHSADGAYSYVDYNRCGVPLLEIVSEPDMHSAEEVLAYVRELRARLCCLGVSDCKMQEGSMRVDVNLSVHEKGTPLGTRTEMKNLSSLQSIKRAIAAESSRQQTLLENGEAVLQETRRFDEAKGISLSMRSKENAQDYRYFPEPDIAPIWISEEQIQALKALQPEMPAKRKQRYQEKFGLSEYDAGQLTADFALSRLFEAALAAGALAKETANWLMTEKQAELPETDEAIALRAGQLAELFALIKDGVISRTTAKEIDPELVRTGQMPSAYVKANGLAIVTDEAGLFEVMEAVLYQNPQSVTDYLSGKEKALGFLIGQMMRALSGKGDAGAIRTMLVKHLQEKK